MSSFWQRLSRGRPPRFNWEPGFWPEERRVLREIAEIMKQNWDGKEIGVVARLDARGTVAAAVALPKAGVAGALVNAKGTTRVKKLWVLREQGEVACAAGFVAYRSSPTREAEKGRQMYREYRAEVGDLPNDWRLIAWGRVRLRVSPFEREAEIEVGELRRRISAKGIETTVCLREWVEERLGVEVEKPEEAERAIVAAVLAGRLW